MKELSIRFGIKEIDDQHAEINEVVDRLVAAIETRKSNLDVHFQLVHLYDLTARHFTLEESLMGVFQYPRRELHIEMHRGILEKLNALKRMSLTTGDIDWSKLDSQGMFLSHIDDHDRDLCRFIADRLPTSVAQPNECR